MLFAVTYYIHGITNPGGYVDHSEKEIVDFAKVIAEGVLDQLGGLILHYDWYSGSDPDVMIDPRDLSRLLESDDIEEVTELIRQISEVSMIENVGHISLWKYHDIFELIEEHHVASWASMSLKKHIKDARRTQYRLIKALADEWLD